MTGDAERARRAGGLRAAAAGVALAALGFAWLTPFAAASLPGPFSAHMATHMTVVAVAAPLLAFALAGSALDPLRRLPAALLAVPASLVELLVVWSWHAPELHDLARRSSIGFAAEQATFLTSALAVWLCVAARDRSASECAGQPGTHRESEAGTTSAAGIVALLLTSMHMTLLGALLALAPRPLYHAHTSAALADQHLGGALMLCIGGVVYLGAGLLLATRLVSHRAAARPAPPPKGVRA
jgi:putative membrane protein